MANVYVEDLKLYIEECVAEAVDEAAKDTVDYLTNYIMKNWYNKYNPKEYQRTYDFLHSVSKTDTKVNGNRVVCMIYFDVDKIHPNYVGPWHFNQHTSFSGKDVSEKIPTWIELGNPKIYGRSGRPLGSMDATVRMLEKNFHNIVAKYLRKQGLNIEVK